MMTALEDREQVVEIVVDLKKWCDDQQVPPTLFNAILAFYHCNYGDWLGGDDIYPMCEPEDKPLTTSEFTRVSESRKRQLTAQCEAFQRDQDERLKMRQLILDRINETRIAKGADALTEEDRT
jgi:hypothetical protein